MTDKDKKLIEEAEKYRYTKDFDAVWDLADLAESEEAKAQIMQIAKILYHKVHD